MAVKVILRDYLVNLKEQEQTKPLPERRHIPTVVQFADAAGVSKTGFLDFTHNRNQSINRKIMNCSIKLLRACGFATDISDLVVYIPDEDDYTEISLRTEVFHNRD